MNPRIRNAVLVVVAVLVVLVLALVVGPALLGETTAPPEPSSSATAEPATGPTPSPSTPEPSAGSPDDVVLGLGGAVGDELWLPEERALRELAAALGPPDATETSTACPDGAARRVHRWDDLAVWVSLRALDPGGSVPGLEPVEPPFVEGWALTGPSPALRTHEGLGVGSAVGELLDLYPEASPAPDGDAWEVFRGDFSNLVVEATSSAPDGTVTAMVSGSVCAPR